MNEKRFFRITRRTGLNTVLESIQHAQQLGFPRVKVNVVLTRNVNEDELPLFCELARDNRVTVRFIEFMPFDGDKMWESGHNFLSAEMIVNRIIERYPSIEHATGTRTGHHIFQVPGSSGKIGVIPAFTRSVCGNCSRIRLTADGKIRNCLYSDDKFDLKGTLRSECDDHAIAAVFRKALGNKEKDGFEAKKRSMTKRVELAEIGRISMTQIGG